MMNGPSGAKAAGRVNQTEIIAGEEIELFFVGRKRRKPLVL
jgi:hypothetical protein